MVHGVAENNDLAANSDSDVLPNINAGNASNVEALPLVDSPKSNSQDKDVNEGGSDDKKLAEQQPGQKKQQEVKKTEKRSLGAVMFSALKAIGILLVVLVVIAVAGLFYLKGSDGLSNGANNVLEGVDNPLALLDVGVKKTADSGIKALDDPKFVDAPKSTKTSDYDIGGAEKELPVNDEYVIEEQAKSAQVQLQANGIEQRVSETPSYEKEALPAQQGEINLSSGNFLTVAEFNAFRTELNEQFSRIQNMASNAHYDDNIELVVEKVVMSVLEKHAAKMPGTTIGDEGLLRELRNGIIEAKVAKRLADDAAKGVKKISDQVQKLDEKYNKRLGVVDNKLARLQVADNALIKVAKNSNAAKPVEKPVPPFSFLMNETFSNSVYSTFSMNDDNAMLVIGKGETRNGWTLIKASISDSGHVAVLQHVATGHKHTFKTDY